MKLRLIPALLLSVLLLLSAVLPAPVRAEDSDPDQVEEEISLDAETEEESPGPAEPTARDAFIEDIIALGKELYDKADGKYQRAHYKGDIYVCKNFTVHLFRQTRAKYRMAEYPDRELKIPNNLPEKKCRPYAYGYCWEEIAASDGNPFYEAAQFLYDKNLSKEENIELARDFMKQVRKGDFFQMTGDYSGGKGAHSAIFMSDYDPETDSVRSLESNRAGKRIKGLRYGKVMYDYELDIDEWIGFFCRKKCGATLYRLRDDIIFAENDK
ncbi:MAG: hypothetical protein K6F61_00535 [Clostridiales bacterium]|nr:hypothetical protein [Clostridiales bacterium]